MLIKTLSNTQTSSLKELGQILENKNLLIYSECSGKMHLLDKSTSESTSLESVINRLSDLCFVQNYGLLNSKKKIDTALIAVTNLKKLHEASLTNLKARSVFFSTIPQLLDRFWYGQSSKLNQLETSLIMELNSTGIRKKEALESTIAQLEKSLPKDPFTSKLRSYHNSNMDDCCAGVYIATNEHIAESIQKLLSENVSKASHRIHIGFSSWYNFDLIAQGNCSNALLCDFNPETRTFLRYSLHYLRTSNNRQEFVKNIQNFIDQTQNSRFMFSENIILNTSAHSAKTSFTARVQQEVDHELHRPGSWLSNDESFNYLKKLALNDKIAVITEDVTSVDTFKKIAQLLKDNSYEISSLYLSNIFDYCKDEKQSAFIETAQSLIEDHTVVISAGHNSELRSSESGSSLYQFASLGKTCKEDLNQFFAHQNCEA